MRHLLSQCFALSVAGIVGWASLANAEPFATSVVQIYATAADGAVKFGSGVAIAPGRIATACHVTRHSTTTEIVHGRRRWIAESQVGSLAHDLCVLIVPTADIPVARMRPSRELQPNERVIAAGFQDGGRELVTGKGTVAALYAYDRGNVIRTTASFDFGSSGGGLFDEAGNLVGILAFKARTGEDLRFALPSEWIFPEGAVSSAFATIQPTSTAVAFWERSRGDRPAFLGVALAEAAAPREHDRVSRAQ